MFSRHILQLVLVHLLHRSPKLLHSSNIILRFLHRIGPLGKGIKIEMSLESDPPQLIHGFQSHGRVYRPEHHSVFRGQSRIPIIQLNPKEFVPHHRNALRRVLSGHEHVSHIQRQPHIRSIDLLDQHHRRSGTRHGKEPGILIGGFEFQRPPDIGMSIATLPKGVDQLRPFLAVVDLKGVIVSVVRRPDDHFFRAEDLGHVGRSFGQFDGGSSRGGIGMIHRPSGEFGGISEADRPGAETESVQSLFGFLGCPVAGREVLGVIEVDAAESADLGLSEDVVAGRGGR
mmetsp:Transcript_16523/g.34554  ORF Transcript_16523/g.34554 Transcript_16523/m.34554 type:complete len:286 (-) Transcript_16523:1097-1954(-)